MITQEARSDVYINGQQAGQELEKLAGKAEKLKKEMVDLKKANDKAGFDKKQKELREVSKEMKNLQQQAFDVNKVLSNLKSSSLDDLYKAQRRLNREMKNLPPNSDEFKKMSKDAQLLSTQIDKVKTNIRGQNTSITASSKLWSNMKSLLPVAGLSSIVYLLGRVGSGMLDLKKEMDGDAKRSSIVFGDQLGYVSEQADKLARKMGLTNQQFIANAASTADLLIPLDFSREKAAQMSIQLQSLTGALDEWTGGQIGAKEVSNILTKAMLGENEQLKQLGIAIKMDSEEFRDLVKVKMETEKVTKAQAQAMATLELIQKKSTDAQRAYNTEGNRLLRIQKDASRQVRLWKENLVKRFDIPTAKLIQEEADKANYLVAQLMNTNIEEEKRREIFDEVKKLYPDILKGISQENIDTKKLTTNLAKYNEQIAQKIVLSNLEEKEQKIISKQAQKQTELILLQSKAQTLLNKQASYLLNLGVTKEILDEFEQLNELIIGSNVQEINGSEVNTIFDVIIEKSKLTSIHAADASNRLHESFLAMIPSIDQAGNALRKHISENSDALLILEEARKQITSNLDISELSDEKTNEALETKAEYQAYLYYEKIKEEIFKRKKLDGNPIDWIFEEDEIIPDDSSMIDNWVDNFFSQFDESLKNPNEKFNLFNMDSWFDEDLYNNRKSMLEHLLSNDLITAEKYNEALSNLENQKQQLLEKGIQLYENVHKKTVSISADIVKAMVSSWDERKQAEINYNKDVAALKEEYKSGEIELEEFEKRMALLNKKRKEEEVELEKARGKAVLKVILDYIHKYLIAKIAEINIGSLASAESIATFGAAGLVKAAALTALVEGSYQIAVAKLSQNYTGRYPVIGASDNMMYSASYSGPAITGVYTSPTLVAERGTEMIIDNPTLSNISINRPDIIQDIMSLRIPQRAEGNYLSASVSSSHDYSRYLDSISKELKLLRQDLRLGAVKAVVDDYQAREIRNKINIINDIESSVTK